MGPEPWLLGTALGCSSLVACEGGQNGGSEQPCPQVLPTAGVLVENSRCI